MFNTYPRAGVERDGSSLANYYERRGQIAAFAGVSIYRPGKAIVGEAGSTEREETMQVSPEFFTTFGLGPMPGRAFTEAETSFETDNVAILTDAYWRQHYSADPDVIGKQIRVDGLPQTVIGVDEDFAQYYWPDGNVIGQRLFEGSEQRDAAEAFTVVGVFGSVKQAGLTEETAQGAVYYPYAFRNDSDLFVVARTSLPPEFLGLTLQKGFGESIPTCQSPTSGRWRHASPTAWSHAAHRHYWPRSSPG